MPWDVGRVSSTNQSQLEILKPGMGPAKVALLGGGTPGKVPAVGGGWMGVAQSWAGDQEIRAGSELPSGAVWGKHTLTALPADAISPRASISLRRGPDRSPAATCSRRRHPAAPPQPATQQAPTLGHFGWMLRSAPAIPTAAAAMKVTAYASGSYFTESVCVDGACHASKARWAERGRTACSAAVRAGISPLSIAAGRDLAGFSDFCLAAARRMCLLCSCWPLLPCRLRSLQRKRKLFSLS